MNPKDKGLTVGELTMAIGVLIIASLVWSSFNKKDGAQPSSLESINPIEINRLLLKKLV